MDLKNGYSVWTVRNGLMHAFPQPEVDVACDVLVVGDGTTGALIADELVTPGHSVVVDEQRDIAWGSTAASTALLQYEMTAIWWIWPSATVRTMPRWPTGPAVNRATCWARSHAACAMWIQNASTACPLTLTFARAAAFAGTEDGLPFFGPHAPPASASSSRWPTAAKASPARRGAGLPRADRTASAFAGGPVFLHRLDR